MLLSVQIGETIECCTVKPYMRRTDYHEPMVWCHVHSTRGPILRKLVLPARLLNGQPLHHNAVTYQIKG